MSTLIDDLKNHNYTTLKGLAEKYKTTLYKVNEEKKKTTSDIFICRRENCEKTFASSKRRYEHEKNIHPKNNRPQSSTIYTDDEMKLLDLNKAFANFFNLYLEANPEFKDEYKNYKKEIYNIREKIKKDRRNRPANTDHSRFERMFGMKQKLSMTAKICEITE